VQDRHQDIDDERIGIQRKNGIDGLLAIFHGAHNLERLTECLANYCDHLLMIISEHHTNFAHGNPFGNVDRGNEDTHGQIVLSADLSLLSLATVPLGAIYRKCDFTGTMGVGDPILSPVANDSSKHRLRT
jgi:hypothetical protein